MLSLFIKRILVCTPLILCASWLQAAGNPVAGEHKARPCAVCHGSEGISISPLFPNLAGQKEAYIVSALTAFRSEERRGASAEIMWGQAANLTDEDIADLGAYFSALQPGQ